MSDRLPVDDLAQEIRRVDGNHDLGAGALAEKLMPFLHSWIEARCRTISLESWQKGYDDGWLDAELQNNAKWSYRTTQSKEKYGRV